MNTRLNKLTPRIIVVLLLFALASAAGAEKQSLEAVRESVERHVRTEFKALGTISTVEVSHLDPRLVLAPCELPLVPFTPNGQQRLGHATIGVRCEGGRPWTLYVPVRITSNVKILTARQPLMRGSILAEQDLALIERDAASLPYGYFTNPAMVVGQQLRRSVRTGEVLSPAMVTPAPLVQRGQKVWISVQATGISVAMQGEALADGAAGERIRVRNMSSMRVLEAEVVSSNRVQVAW